MANDPPAEDATATAEGEGYASVEAPEDPIVDITEGRGEEPEAMEVGDGGDGDVGGEEKAQEEADAMNYEAVVSDLESRHAKLEEENEAFKGKLDLQTAELSESKKQILALTEEKVRLEQEVAAEKRKADSGSADHMSLEQELKALKERLDRKDVEADALREEIRYVQHCAVLMRQILKR